MKNLELRQLNSPECQTLNEQEMSLVSGGFSFGLDFGSDETRNSVDNSRSQDRSGNRGSIVNASNDTISNVNTSGGHFYADPASISIA